MTSAATTIWSRPSPQTVNSRQSRSGATTSYSTGVSILPARHKLPNKSGNVFTADQEPSISVRWIDDRTLSISGDTQTHYLHLTEFRGVRITYD